MITRDNFIRNKKIQYFLLLVEYCSCLDEGIQEKLKLEFLVEFYAKQYDFRLKLGHILACKISCNQRKKKFLRSITSQSYLKGVCKILTRSVH